MKQLLLSICLLFSSLVMAKENVTIIYGWNASDSVANYGRILAAEANKLQDKYNFILDARPGAGNAIAANYVKNTPNTILFTSPAFFIRPIFYPNESYNISDYKPFMPLCDGPMVVSSVKYKSWKEVPTDKPISIGTSGLGVASHLIALQLVEKYPNMMIVPFKSTSDALLAIISGQVDFGVAFLTDTEVWVKENKTVQAHILGTTGFTRINKYPTLVESGFPKSLGNSNLSHQLIVPKSIPDDKFREWRMILIKAANSTAVKDAYKADSCYFTSDVLDKDLTNWFNIRKERWSKLANSVKLDK